MDLRQRFDTLHFEIKSLFMRGKANFTLYKSFRDLLNSYEEVLERVELFNAHPFLFLLFGKYSIFVKAEETLNLIFDRLSIFIRKLAVVA